MALLIVGIVLLALKLGEIGPVAEWSWWTILAPFGLAVVWWGLADSMGLTQRRAMDKMEAKKVERRNRNLEALGLAPKNKRRPAPANHGFTASSAQNRVSRDPVSAAADDAARADTARRDTTGNAV
jgi:small Trp-rich protein